LGAGAKPAWPSKPLRIIVVYPPGGISDQICRFMAHQASILLKASVIVENRAGGGGSVGMAALAQAAPDGHTLGFAAITTLTSLPKFNTVSYDPQRDFAPVVGVMRTPTLVLGTPIFPGHRLSDVLHSSHQSAKGLRWATSGVGTTGHMVLEQVRLATQANLIHIPYKGGAQQINDALAGQFELLSTNLGMAQLQYVQTQKLKALAIGAPARVRSLSDVPTLEELGFPKANLMSTFGVFAPAKTSKAIIEQLNAIFNTTLSTAEFRSRLSDSEDLLLGGTPEQFAQLISKEAGDLHKR
jgi:tripartite-type tricarboxylate transporter receptor subunit TctC